jgi:uncharacterized protein YndB with AHSA1/START domain
MSAENTREIVISRVLNAPRDLAWEAMTNPLHVVRWWGPRGFTSTIEEMDVRPGGVWKHVMHGPDGTDYPNHSVFTEVVKPERICFSHGGTKKGGTEAQFEATWTFDALEGGKTRVTIRMVFPSAELRNQVVKEYGAIEGGEQTLARLAEQLAAVPVVVERTFNAPMEMVWKAITEREQMIKWSFPVEAFKAEVGFETQFNKRKGDRDFLHLWKVTEVVLGRKITYSWKYGGFPGESFVTFELFDEGGKTRLKLTHTGLETFQPESNPDLARSNFVMGWTHIIGTSLEGFLEKSAPYIDQEFVISRVFDAPRELVWKAWTDPRHMTQWWGPRDFTNPVCELDVRVGGAYRITMRAPDGAEYPLHGFYREIVEPERLVMSMDCSAHPESWHDMVNPHRDKTKKPTLDCVQTVTLEKVGEVRTRLTIRTRFESVTIRDGMLKVGMTEGWSLSLDRLASCLAKM